MARPKRNQKLKVFRTPIGFHDAYVAAPSQKAALEAWGAESNLFAGGSAEQVTDAALMKVPLEHPGQVVKVLRGTKAEQLAALGKQKLPKRTAPPRAEVVPPRSRKLPKPSGAKVEKAEKAVEGLAKRHEEQISLIERKERELERQRRELLRRQERERDEAQEKLDEERAAYEAALRRYQAG